jgi:tripartite-type tricarboxylate transporter receptor subunit TctC
LLEQGLLFKLRKIKMKKIISLALMFLFAGIGPAYGWKPTEPIKVIIGQTPGSGNEVVFRQIASRVTEQTGASFVIENHPGLDGTIAWNRFGSRPANGHHITVQALETSLVALPIQYPNQLTTDPNQAIVVTPLASTPEVFVVLKDSPIKNYQDLVEAFRNKKLNVGTSGSVAALTYYKFVQDVKSQNKDLQMIPYKSIPSNLTDLIGGSIDISVVPAVSTKGLYDGGKIRIVAVADDQPLPTATSATLITKHIPDFDIRVTYTVFLPKDTPNEIVNWYINHFAPAIKDPAVKSWLTDQWTTPFTNIGTKESQKYSTEVKRKLKSVAEKTLKPVNN